MSDTRIENYTKSLRIWDARLQYILLRKVGICLTEWPTGTCGFCLANVGCKSCAFWSKSNINTSRWRGALLCGKVNTRATYHMSNGRYADSADCCRAIRDQIQREINKVHNELMEGE